ncbi:invasion associated locus B family protein [Starkeya koreensis]|uniref:Invasion associated locus B family protein n=1 Tax=Ancylobacter koreensis TaxID=266121 RepID=A0ABT0DRG8_9HYPH|nr:invasion associated locus B family protein [Ancylobacter koreensis]MCK0209876.1 invasion associated locus B family protein [Ancylobacter koreensis]
MHPVTKLAVGLLALPLLVAGPAAMAQQAPAESAAPVRTETTVFDNWVVTCRAKLEKGAKRSCAAALKVTESKSQKTVLLWQIGQDAAGAPAYLIRTPLGVRIKDGVQIVINKGKPRKVDFASCTSNGCEATGTFDDAFAKELTAAKEVMASFVLTTGQTVQIALPIGGIDKALPALKG